MCVCELFKFCWSNDASGLCCPRKGSSRVIKKVQSFVEKNLDRDLMVIT